MYNEYKNHTWLGYIENGKAIKKKNKQKDTLKDSLSLNNRP